MKHGQQCGLKHSANAQQQRGAVAVFVAIGIVALVASLLLVVDIGRLYYSQRQLQTDANMAALAAAQAGSGCLANSNGVPGNKTDITDAVLQSLKNNRGRIDSLTDLGVPTVTKPDVVDKDFMASSLAPGGKSVVAAWAAGQTVISTNKNIRTFKAEGVGNAKNDSVQVTLATRQPKSFLSYFFHSSTTKYLYASATAKQQALGSFYLGTEIANVDGGMLNDVLGGLLCAPGDTDCQSKIVGLDVGDSRKGLAGVDLSLGQLATAAGVDVTDLNNLLSAQTTLPEILKGLSNVVPNIGVGVSGTVKDLLLDLAKDSSNSNQFLLGSIIGTVNNVAPDVPFIDLPDLLVALGEAAQQVSGGGIQSIELPIRAHVKGVLAAKTFLKVGSPPKFSGLVAAGTPGAIARTAEVTLTTRLQVPLLKNLTGILNGVLGLLGTTIDLGDINLGIDVHVAPASAKLNQLQCPLVGPPATPLTARLSADTAVATVDVGTYQGNAASNPPLSHTEAPIVLAKVKAVFGLASTNVFIDLKHPLSTTVGEGGGNLDPVDQFKKCASESTDPYCAVASGTSSELGPPEVPYFLAWGAPKLPYTAPGAPGGPQDNPQTVGSTDLLSSSVSTLFVSLQNNLSTGNADNPSKLCVLLVCLPLNKLLDPLLDGVTAALTPVLVGTTGVVDTLLNPLLAALGVHVGTATVTMNTASFNQPVIVTNCLPLDHNGSAKACRAPASASST